MNLFHADPTPFKVLREDSLVIVENRYIRCIHDLNCGGEMTEAVVKHGSGKNLFARPQATIIGIIENGIYHCFRSDRKPVKNFELLEQNGNPVLKFRLRLHDDSGKVLNGLEVIHQVEYTPWGEALHRVTLAASHRINNLGMVQIGTLWPSKYFDSFAVQESLNATGDPYMGNRVKSWLPLTGGKHRNDRNAYFSRWLPVATTVLKSGVDGFQFTLGDDLEQWDSIGGTLPGFQMGYFSFNSNTDSYELRFAPLDSRREGQYLDGEKHFDFSLAFPHVRKKIVPLIPCAGAVHKGAKSFEKRWPDKEKFARWKEAETAVLRIHNDGDLFGNGIFWRSTSYPPYPPDEMVKMDNTIQRFHELGISVVPYFSLHEYHPEAPCFNEHAQEWGRIAAENDGIIPSYFTTGYYGYQMCLRSDWFEKRRDTIDEVLTKHDFDGVYYDWCIGMECLNPLHGHRHRDMRKLLKLLEWSHERVGNDGELYLHLTYNPNLTAENMASLVLTEETGGASIDPEMFSPHVHFLNIVPRQVCDMLPEDASDADRKRFIMCAILNHATISASHPVFLSFWAKHAHLFKECGKYVRHTAPGEGLCTVSNPKVGISVYWNQTEKMVLLANLSEREEKTEFSFVTEASEAINGTAVIPALELKVLKFN